MLLTPAQEAEEYWKGQAADVAAAKQETDQLRAEAQERRAEAKAQREAAAATGGGLEQTIAYVKGAIDAQRPSDAELKRRVEDPLELTTYTTDDPAIEAGKRNDALHRPADTDHSAREGRAR